MRLHVCDSPRGYRPFPREALGASIPERFAAQVGEHADCVAVHDQGTTVTYRELDAWSNGVAHAIAGTGRPDEPVILLMRQGAANVAATLGALKAGRAYVPLDPTDPSLRIRRLAERVGASAVVVDREPAASSADGWLTVITADGLASPSAPAVTARSTSVAYVYFTSGTTGEPKGVYDNHRNVLHNVLRYTEMLRIAPSDRLTLLQAPSFSGAVSSQFAGLLNGATVFPFRPGEDGVVRLADLIVDSRLTIYHSVPALFRALAGTGRAFPSLRIVRLEGDRATGLDVDLFNRVCRTGAILANGLGTTETGLARQLILPRGSRPDGEGILPVGYPVPEVDVVVLDESGGELPPGSPGEIGVRSRYLALGYWRQPEATAAAFLSSDGDMEIRTYRTGDTGMLREDGCLEYHGRLDFHLKVRGHRVDPAEVETELLRHPDVRDAVVTTTAGRHGEGRLDAYVVPAPGRSTTPETLREHLTTRLPSYAVPTRFAEIASLPLGPNGKIDRSALRMPEAASGATAAAVGSGLAEAIAAIWSDVLETPVGLDDDFFELGGDSLAAAEMAAAIEAALDFSIPLSAFAASPTVRSFTASIGREEPAPTESIVGALDPEGPEPPLFLIHGLNGNTLHLVPLARAIGGRRRVLGVEPAPGVRVSGVEQLAADHVRAIRRAEPEGPYLIGGYCAGGALAFEVARQLTTDSARVALLALLGIGPADLPTLLSGAAHQRWRHANQSARTRLARRWAETDGQPTTRRAWHMATRLAAAAERRTVGRLRPAVTAPPTLADALAAYAPPPATTPSLLVLEEETLVTYTTDPAGDWSRLTETRLEVHVVPGPFHSILDDPASTSDTAEILVRAAERALER